MKCPNPVNLAGVLLIDRTPTTREVPCNLYRCEACAPGRRARVVGLMRAGVRHARKVCPGSPVRLITFTYPRDVAADFHNRLDMIDTSTRLRRVVQRLRRSGVRFEYARIPEATKSGRIHLHLIAWGAFVPKCTDRGRRTRELSYGPGSGSPCYCTQKRPCIQSAAWAEGFGFVDVRKVKSVDSAAGYVAKYLAKQTDMQDWPRYARRFSYSRQFAGGQTLGGRDRAWFDARLAAMSRLERAEQEAREVIWLGLSKRKLFCEQMPPLPRPPPVDGVLMRTGEILPIPV